VWYTSPPTFADIDMTVKDDKCLACLARMARCGTPVPHPLSVMNSVKTKSVKRFVAGEGICGR